MMNDFDESLYCTEVQAGWSKSHCTPTGCEAEVDGELRSDEIHGNA
jgi:hypothetical protein